MLQTKGTPALGRARWLRVWALVMVVAVDVCLYKQPMGWLWGVLGLALVAGLWHKAGVWRTRGAVLAVSLFAAVASLSMLHHTNGLALFLWAFALLCLSTLVRWRGRGLWSVWLAVPLGVVSPLVAWARDARLVKRWGKRPHGLNKRGGAGLLGWLLPVVLALVFVGLFALANPVVSSWLSDAWAAIDKAWLAWADWVSIPRWCLWVATGLGVWGLHRVPRGWFHQGSKCHRRHPRKGVPGAAVAAASLQSPNPPAAALHASNGPFQRPAKAGQPWPSVGLAVRCLVLLNLVFAMQTGLDMRYLWGGAALPEGMTHATYAHRGAYPLVATALLAGLVVLVAFRPGGPAVGNRWARWLVHAFILQNVLLLASSVFRLSLYVDAYSLTKLRVAAGIWMLLVAGGFACVWARIAKQRSNRWMLDRVVAMAGLVLLPMAWIDWDAVIASHNIAWCAEVQSGEANSAMPDVDGERADERKVRVAPSGGSGGGRPLDVAYLKTLGPTALPALKVALDTHRGQWSPTTLEQLENLQRNWSVALAMDLANVRGWTWRKQRAWQALGQEEQRHFEQVAGLGG